MGFRRGQTQMMNSATKSEGGKVSDIQVLTDRVRDLTQAIDRWNTAVIWGLVATALAAVFIVIATRIVVAKSKKLTEAQTELAVAKDRQLALDLKGKDKEIGELKLKSESLSAEAEKAKEGIATAQAEAAIAKANAAKSELALETFRAQQANPRMIVLSDRDGDDLERSRRASEVKKFSGTRVLIQALPDFEPRTLASAIAVELANEYKWQVEMIDPERSRIPFSVLTPGVKVITLEEPILELGDPATAKVKMPAPAKSRSYPAALALVNLLNLDLGEPYGPQYFGVHWEAEYDDPRFRAYTHWGFALPGDTVLILVGAKCLASAGTGEGVLPLR
jgi:hypothetical protein